MVSREHFQEVENKITSLLASFNSFSNAEKAEVRQFVQVGEYGVALETAFQIAIEEHKSISKQTFGLFQELVDAMGIDDSVDIAQLAQLTEVRHPDIRVDD